MRLEFHPGVQRDFVMAISYYERKSLRIAERFEAEFRAVLLAISAQPRRFSFLGVKPSLRRAQLESFPYVVVYVESASYVRIVVLRHEKRHPLFGLGRR